MATEALVQKVKQLLALAKSGKVDDSLYTRHEVDFTPSTTMTDMAKTVLTVMIGFAVLAIAKIMLMRMQKRAGG